MNRFLSTCIYPEISIHLSIWIRILDKTKSRSSSWYLRNGVLIGFGIGCFTVINFDAYVIYLCQMLVLSWSLAGLRSMLAGVWRSGCLTIDISFTLKIQKEGNSQSDNMGMWAVHDGKKTNKIGDIDDQDWLCQQLRVFSNQASSKTNYNLTSMMSKPMLSWCSCIRIVCSSC